MGTVIGTLSFKLLDARLVAGIVGVFTLLFLAQRLLFPPRPDSRAPAAVAGRHPDVTSGFTSFVSHAGGPPVNAYVIPMRLSPLVFTATMSVFFFVVNLSKWIPYAWLGLLDMRNMATSLALLAFAPIGVHGRRQAGAPHPAPAVLPADLRRDVPYRLQAGVGRFSQ